MKITGKFTNLLTSVFILTLIFVNLLSPQMSFGENSEQDDVISIDKIVLDTEDMDGNEKVEEDEESLNEYIENIVNEDASKSSDPEPVETNTKPILLSKHEIEKADDIYNRALKYIEEGNNFEARKLLSELFFKGISVEMSLKTKEQLDFINKTLVFSPEPDPNSVIYTVKGGDTLGKIASKYNTTYELVMLVNRKPRTNIRVGERLKIIEGTFDILVDKSDYKMTLLLNDHYVKQYDIGTGKNDKTPVGEFEIAEKMIEPTWYSGDGVYPYGTPENVLGTRWIGFKDKPGYYGFGIHGTADPESIGKSESNGCVRLRNEDVEELFVFVTDKTKVVIQN